jgi:transposase
MTGADLLLDCPGLRVTDLTVEADAVTIRVESTATTSTCPRCGINADRVHSRYTRTVTDLPLHGRRTTLVVAARRFFCDEPNCRRTLFCERFPQLTAAHAHTTGPLTESHRAIGFALGGEAGARLAEKLAIPTSPDTLLRRVKAAPDEPLSPPRFVGIDDWAIRKGQHYGTILIDLERRRVIDILPGRDGVALKTWLQEHPGVEVITRDRWSAFAQAAKEGAPAAKQVADRWHLLKNLREAVERILDRFSSQITTIAQQTAATEVTSQAPAATEEPTTESRPGQLIPAEARVPTPAPAPLSAREQARQAKKEAREQRHRLVREMRDQGHSIRVTARQLGVSTKMVIRYRRQETCPDWKPGRRGRTQVDPYQSDVEQWISGGGRNTKDLHRLLGEKGCRACYDAVRRYVNRIVGSTGVPGRRTGDVKPPPPSVPSARKLSFELVCPPKPKPASGVAEQNTEPGLLDRLRAGIPNLAKAWDVASELVKMIRKELSQPLSDWLTKADESGASELKSFAKGLREDESAVAAALREPWSNGPVEGQVNRLKFIKRSMYGRAGWRLLRARVKRKV